jgi:hypothetical protein
MADKIDISSFQIAASKMHANGNAYFKLFEKYVPRNLGLDSVVLLYKLDNLSCIYKIVNMNSKTHYVVVSNDAVNNALQVVLDKAIDVEYIKEFDFKETDMKFDCIVMNPPYSRNLHLKILAEAIKHLKDDGTCVNLSPIRWLQDPLAKYKKTSDLKRFEESVAKHIESLETFDTNVISQVFDGGIPSSAIYVVKQKTLSNLYKTKFDDSIIDKIYSMTLTRCTFDSNMYDGARVKISPICGYGTSGNHSDGKEYLRSLGKLICFVDGLKDGKPWYSFYAHNGATKIQKAIPYSIKFNSINEANNFILSYELKLAKYYTHQVKRDVNVSPETIFWLGDAINPRTGKKGYTSEWTNDDLYKFFNITSAEQKVIEETMAKYDSK